MRNAARQFTEVKSSACDTPSGSKCGQLATDSLVSVKNRKIIPGLRDVMQLSLEVKNQI